jgi:hypothetical protein
MAVITISPTGGNYNATSSWVGGVVPLTTDSIVGTASSGNLTVNVASTCAGFDFTNYVGTLTLTLGLVSSGASTFGSGMTITNLYNGSLTQGIITFNGNQTIRTNGLTIPYVFFSGTNTTKTLQDDMTITNLSIQMGNINPTVNGFSINLTNARTTGTGGGSFGYIQGTTIFKFNGTNCLYENNLEQCGISNNPVQINTTGKMIIGGTGSNIMGKWPILVYNNNQFASLTYIQGSMTASSTQAGDPILSQQMNLYIYTGQQGTGNATNVRLDLGSMSRPWDRIEIRDTGNATPYWTHINLVSDLKFNFMRSHQSSINAYTNQNGFAPRTFIVFESAGTADNPGVLRGGTFSALINYSMIGNTMNKPSYNVPMVQFQYNTTGAGGGYNSTTYGVTHSFSCLNIQGDADYPAIIQAHNSVGPIGLSFSNPLIYCYLNSTNTVARGGSTFSNSSLWFQAPQKVGIYGGKIQATFSGYGNTTAWQYPNIAQGSSPMVNFATASIGFGAGAGGSYTFVN